MSSSAGQHAIAQRRRRVWLGMRANGGSMPRASTRGAMAALPMTESETTKNMA